jgi:peptidoglycan/LPS O-acetylase OafA/YrhL
LSSSSNIARDKTNANAFGAEPSVPATSSRSFTRDLRYHPAYRPDIDGLRALAIITVLLFHAFPTVLPGGFIGVDIFFVISGFLISSVIFVGLQRKSFSFLGFYANRIKRIFPALLLVLIACFVAGWLFLFPGEYAGLGKHIVAGAAYIENLVLRRELGYFDTESLHKPLLHLWSLGIEEQFYLTYPFLVWAVWRLRRNMFAVLGSLVLISFLFNVWRIRTDAASSFLLPQTRFWELWMGGILAYVDIFRPQVRRRFTMSWDHLTPYAPTHELTSPPALLVSNALSIVGALLIASALLLVREHGFPGWWALLPVVGASLLILGGRAAWINRRILSHPIAVFIGLISYPLYLWHWPILSFARILHGDELSRGVRFAVLILSFALAWATWRFVEAPIRFGRTTWIKTALLVLVSVIVAGGGYEIHARGGLDSRFKNRPVDFDDPYPEMSSTPECLKTVALEKMANCRSSGAGAPEVLLIGDSHAGSLYHGLALAYTQRSQTLMNLGEPPCVPFYDTRSYTLGMPQVRDCQAIVNRMLEFATSARSVRTIILSVRGPKNMQGREFGAYAYGPPEVVLWAGAPKNSSQADMFVGAFRNTVSRLSAAGKNVILFIDWPELDFDPRSCIARPVSWFSNVRSLCGVPRSQVDARNRAYRKVIFDMQSEFRGVKVFDPLPYVCNATACYVMHDGHFLYRDNNHLSAAGSVYLASAFLAEQSADGGMSQVPTTPSVPVAMR